MSQIKRCAIYIRVSTAEQAMHGKSLQAQKDFLEQYAVKHNMEIAGIYADEGQTARKELRKRKAIHALLADVENRKIDVVLFWKMDRWFRSVSDFYKVQEILDKHKVTWIAAAEPNMNMETRDGRLNLNIILSIGQNEVDTTSERIRFTVNNMIENGRLVWGEKNMPFGYCCALTDGHKKMVKDEKNASVVDEIFRYYLNCHSKSKTVRHINELYDIPFSYGMLRTMLSSEFYIGKYRNCLNYCPAYLTEDTWNKIKEVSSSAIKSTPSGRIYLFSGLLCCPLCGRKLSAAGCSSVINRQTGEKRTYCYYRCNYAKTKHLCAFSHILSQNTLEEYLIRLLFKEQKKWVIQVSKISAAEKLSTVVLSAKKIQSEMDRLNLLFQKNRISLSYYEHEFTKLEHKLESAEHNIRENVPPSYSEPDIFKISNLITSDFSVIYNYLSPENQQVFWHRILQQIHLSEDGTIQHISLH